MIDNGLLVIVLGISGSGKSDLVNKMVSEYKVNKIKTYTTQPVTRWDAGKYHFINIDKFQEMQANKELSLIRKVSVPSDDVMYTEKFHMYGAHPESLKGGGIIILDWEGYSRLLSYRQSNIVAFILEADVGAAYRRKVVEHPHIDDFEVMFERLLKDNSGVYDYPLIDRLVKDFRIYKIDAESGQDNIFQTVDTILKGL